MCDAPAPGFNNRLKHPCRHRFDIANTFDEWGREHAGRCELTGGKIFGFFAAAKLWLFFGAVLGGMQSQRAESPPDADWVWPQGRMK
jgi:hypothetical protein